MNSSPSLAFNSASKTEGARLTFAFSGVFDENADLPEIPAGAFQEIVIDLDGVPYMNSLGLKKWMLWINAIEKDLNGVKIVLHHARNAVIRQTFMISNFLPPSIAVDSFYVSYYCPDCSDQHDFLLDRSAVAKMGENAYEQIVNGTPPCPKCGKPMEYDSDPKLIQIFDR